MKNSQNVCHLNVKETIYHFVLIFRYPSAIDMQKIVQCMLSPVLNKFDNMNENENLVQLAESMINVYTEVSSYFFSVQIIFYVK